MTENHIQLDIKDSEINKGNNNNKIQYDAAEFNYLFNDETKVLKYF
jgi:hypothetical protein